jgi:hypothetical protein
MICSFGKQQMNHKDKTVYGIHPFQLEEFKKYV